MRTAPPGAASTNALGFSPDGSRIASYTPDGAIAIWDVETGERLQTMPGQERYVCQTQWSPEGTVLASASVDGTVHLWDIATGERLYTAEQNGTVYAWSVPEGDQVEQWTLKKGQLFDLDAADTRIAAGGKAEQVHVVDTETGTVLHRFDHGDFLNNIVVVEGRPTVASVSSNGVLKV